MKFRFYNSDFLKSFIKFFEGSRFIYTHYNSIIILDNNTILINNTVVRYAYGK